MRVAATVLLVVLLVIAVPVVTEAGQFVITKIYFTTQLSTVAEQTTSVMVGGWAQYRGEVDADDNNYSMTSNLYSLEESTQGSPLSGGSITENMVLHLKSTQYGAVLDLFHCTRGGLNRTYTGKVFVVIIHGWASPETSEGLDGPHYLECECPPTAICDTGEEPGGEETSGGGGSAGDDPTDPNPISPILVNLDQGGMRLSSLEDGVRFDLDDDGEREHVAWTAPGSGDAWLVLDRDGNGTIDSGRELFGNLTPQPATSEPNGYLALAVFDGPDYRGNEDGVIDVQDPMFSALRLWIDENRDGVSQAWELWRLAARGVQSIDLDYTTSRRRDRHGNEFRYASLVRLEDATTQAADVFPLIEE